MKKPDQLMGVAGLALMLSACASAQAKQPSDRVVLEVPPVPPRVIDPLPVPAEKPAPSEPASEPASRPRPAAPPPVREPAKPEPAGAEPAAQVPPNVPPLRTPKTASDGAEASRQVREALDRARKSLEGVDYGPLSPPQRELYNQAKLFLNQSEEKLKATDFELARNYAERAEQIAKQLQKR